MRRFLALLAAAAAFPASVAAQDAAHRADLPAVAAAAAPGAISLDGALDEAVWRESPAATGFRQEDPDEGAPATQRTEVRFAVDGDALYVGARMFDAEGAAGVTTRLARRDADPESDYLLLTFDTFHDHVGRTEFGVNPSGVKYDAGQAASSADESWDPVWEYAAQIDSLGWTAELRIPLSQLRFPRDSVQTWGLQLTRFVHRLNETSHWSFWPKDEAGGPNRFGHLTGIRMTGRPRGYELMPYALARASYVQPTQPGSPFQASAAHDWRVGADFRALLGSALTLTATVNPDFGQVEVDPAVVNLSAFETFFPERRPFFVEGSGQFGFGGFSCRFCSNVDGMSLFYSRRIGRRPQGRMPGDAVYTDVPENTAILGAAKVTGRLPSGLQVAMLDAVAGHGTGSAILGDGSEVRREVEPLTNYFVARVRQTLDGGNLTVGGIATSVARRFDGGALRTQLPGHAEAVGIDWTAFWNDRTYRLMGNLAFSNVAGDSLAIHRLQTASARYYQRPDRGERSGGILTDRHDPSLTALRGVGGYLRFAKEAGTWQGETMVNFRSPGFEVNDAAFLTRTDYVWMNGNLWRNWNRPTSWYRSLHAVVGAQQEYNFDGDRTARQLHGAIGGQWRNYWSTDLFVLRRMGAYDDRLTRGGPVVRRTGFWYGQASAETDSRRRLAAGANLGGSIADDGTRSLETSLSLRVRPASNVSLSIGPAYAMNETRQQFVTRFDDPSATHFHGQRVLVAGLTQRTLSMDTRLNWTFSPTLSMELFAQPFVASGEYGAFSEFTGTRTTEKRPVDPERWEVLAGSGGADSAYVYTLEPGNPDSRRVSISNPDFNLRSLRGNAVVRWEWRPGSTLFFVWQQQRSRADGYGDFSLTRDAPGVFEAKPDNVFVVKATYWLGG